VQQDSSEEDQERVVKAEDQEKEEEEDEEEEEEVEVEEEEEEQEPVEPTVPPPTQVSMKCQTDESFLSGSKAESSLQTEASVPPEGSLQIRRNQGNQRQSNKQISNRMTQLQNRNLPKHFSMVLISLVMKVIQFSGNFVIVLPMVTMVDGQDSTIKAFQLLLNIDICSGM